MNGDRRAVQRLGRPTGAHRRLVDEIQAGVADLQLGMHDRTAGAVHVVELTGAERLRVEIDRPSRTLHDQMRRDAAGPFGNRAHHRWLLSRGGASETITVVRSGAWTRRLSSPIEDNQLNGSIAAAVPGPVSP